ncbi:hypothetical protein [Flavilitoribacter nigricans]|uniref:Uncharacterized protein n=1 Tax=Flavilitoribacter nigricans (strain ATCC 23147 / DSM 23189 / NBRC 102662 / NCIMB 1420 / SS-2) TaxID=1122177 RepID=A0A2D0MWQ4_FLAN2|nr:hypothetical protein [Flavilitoribacter nigricans]PHN00556.1 hypothetical protein CRP01_41610 [Flavilitoribacter nigricans DSM 23189 = NBRC 102662]
MILIIIQILLLIGIDVEPKRIDCNKCDIDKIKIVNENLEQLDYEMVMEFLCTLDVICRTNTEYSEWSNEMIFLLLENSPGTFFQALQDEGLDVLNEVLDKIKSPVMEFNYQEIHSKIENLDQQGSVKNKILKALAIAAGKAGFKIKK